MCRLSFGSELFQQALLLNVDNIADWSAPESGTGQAVAGPAMGLWGGRTPISPFATGGSGVSGREDLPGSGREALTRSTYMLARLRNRARIGLAG